nr:MAG TPA: hypothetical protein [Caudoviricetes sp.]
MYRNRTCFSLYKMCCHYTNNRPTFLSSGKLAMSTTTQPTVFSCQ